MWLHLTITLLRQARVLNSKLYGKARISDASKQLALNTYFVALCSFRYLSTATVASEGR